MYLPRDLGGRLQIILSQVGGGWVPFQMEGEPSMVLPACPGESVTVLFGDLAV